MKYLKLFEEFSFPVAPVMEDKDKGEPFDIELARATLEKWNTREIAKLVYRGYPDNGFKTPETDKMVREFYNNKEFCKAAVIVLAGQWNLLSSQGSAFFAKGEAEEKLKTMQILIPGAQKEDIWNGDSRARAPIFIKKFEEVKGISEEEAKTRIETYIGEQNPKQTLDQLRYRGNAGLLWNLMIWNSMLTDEERERVAQELMTKAVGLGWDKKSWNKKIMSLEDITSEMNVYFNNVDAKSAKKEIPAASTPPVTTAMLEPSQSSKVFKVNRTGENGAEDYEDDTLKGLADNLGAIFQRLLTGEISELRSILVSTSCDRYRNTGSAEKLTWGQLAYARALSLSSLVLEVAKKSGIPQPKIEPLSKAIKINFKGENGDGTSGPNPLAPKTFGYYDKSGKYVSLKEDQGAKRTEIQVVPIDDDGNSTQVEPKAIDKSKELGEMQDADSYDKFRYSNVFIEYVIVKEEDKQNKPNTVVTYEISYPVGLNVPERFRGRKITIPIPTISFSRDERSTKKSSTSCDNGKGGIKSITRFGLTIKPVTLASWQSEIK
jgi:hypothetical protein